MSAINRPVMFTWLGALRRHEFRSTVRRAQSSDWYARAVYAPMLIVSGPLKLGASRALDPLRCFGDALEGVACTEAQMHSDEHMGVRWHMLCLLYAPGNTVRCCSVLDSGRVETAAVEPGDAFVLDLHRAHAAHAKTTDRLPMLFWSLPLVGINDRKGAHDAAEAIVRMIKSARETKRAVATRAGEG